MASKKDKRSTTTTATKATVPTVTSRRRLNLLDALELTVDTRQQLKLLISLLGTEDGALILDQDAVCGLITWLGLIDDNLQYIELRIDPDFDPDDPLGASAAV